MAAVEEPVTACNLADEACEDWAAVVEGAGREASRLESLSLAVSCFAAGVAGMLPLPLDRLPVNDDPARARPPRLRKKAPRLRAGGRGRCAWGGWAVGGVGEPCLWWFGDSGMLVSESVVVYYYPHLCPPVLLWCRYGRRRWF